MKISAAETQVMDALWRGGALSPEQLIAAVAPANNWTEPTVRTLINRLLHKKALVGERKDGQFRYRPLLSREAYVRDESEGFIDRVFEGKLSPLVAHFAEYRDISAEDLATLKQLIADIEREHG